MSAVAVAVPTTQARRSRPATRRMVATELRLVLRDPFALTFVLVFPVVTMLIIGGSFGTESDPDFAGQNPAQWYVASYFTVVLGATGLIAMPVHIASYRERGVLRRFALAGFPRWSFALAQLAVGLLTFVVSAALLLAVAAVTYGIPALQSPGRVLLGVAVGAVLFISLGVLLGTLLPSARAAQAVGLVLFFPSFLLGVGGPPPEVLGPGLRGLSEVLPLALVTTTVREPWLGIGQPTAALAVCAGLAAAALLLAGRRTAL